MNYFYSVKSNKNDIIDEKNDIIVAKTNKNIIFLKKQITKPQAKDEILCSKNYDIEPVPYLNNDNQNYRVFIGGPSGVGKSTLTSIILKQYKKLYPKQQVFVFSKFNDDPAYQDIKDIKYFDIDNEGLEDLECETDLNNSIIIFDDHICKNNKQQKLLDLKKNELLRSARHYMSDIIVCLDKILKNRDSVNEILHANMFGCFPASGRGELVNFFTRKMNLSKEQINKLLNTSNSRWLLISMRYPFYAIGSDCVFLF